jgi:prolyl-tRNA synthetase
MATEEYLAIPGYTGKKTDSEKFAGAEASYSIEHLLPDGNAIQGPDFHSDGQRFAKAFEITFIDERGERNFAWQNTFAISTRVIGVMLAIHSDDKGAVVPPKVAEVQVVVVPIVTDANKEKVLAEAKRVSDKIAQKFRTKFDDRDQLTPGRKFNEWELKGVPLRVELGPRDIEAGQAVLVRRDTGGKRSAKLAAVVDEVTRELEEISTSLLERAREALRKNTYMTTSYDELKRIIKEKGGIVRAPWCGSAECEDKLRQETGAKILNIPLDQHPSDSKCAMCGGHAEIIANIAKSY